MEIQMSWDYNRLIDNASRCMDRAENIEFKHLWQKILLQLLKNSKKIN